MAELSVRPLDCGTIRTDYSNMVYWTNFGTKIDIPSFIYLIEGADKKTVVDTSFLSPERGTSPTGPSGERPGRGREIS